MPLVALLCLTPWMSSALALLAGIFFALVLGNPFHEKTEVYTHRLLACSVVGLGCGMNLLVVAKVGLHGVGYTIVGIVLTLAVGAILGRLLKLEREIAVLISVGTAICGGSAIAAVGPAIRAKSHSMTVALGTVFSLNALALLLFPPLGYYFSLTHTQFGLWSALAIHDTSSVVGSALQFGSDSVQIATTVKLARALWIVPLTVVASWAYSKDAKAGMPAKRPWFILGFLIAAAVVTWVPGASEAGHYVELVARRTLVLTLFCIGANLHGHILKQVGLLPLVQGFLLWLFAGSATLAAILMGWVS